MKFLTVRELREQTSRIWKELPEQKEMVITKNGHPVAILSSVTDQDLEESLEAYRRTRAQIAVTALQRKSIRSGTDGISMEEIDAEIREVRKQRAEC
ncbi:MAG: type II toxin-antitoxin system Phd/YefM family antitoxin [Candidatus Aegiribacteria sp.]|nr:type II toxin-antitoxin system Phd/YefM family antitoxin [Candidatus Aegiribacteria sp.]